MSPKPNSRKKLHPPLMSHKERRKLIETPIIFHESCGKSWGGIKKHEDEELPTTGRRVWPTQGLDDESYLVTFWNREEET